VVSHDRYFLDRICDQIVAFEDGGVFMQPGNYSYYLEKRKARELQAKARMAPPIPAKELESQKAVKTRKLSFKEQKELDSMEQMILVAETRVEELNTLLNDPEFYVTRAKEAPGLIEELEKAKVSVARLYARWEELEEIVQTAG